MIVNTPSFIWQMVGQGNTIKASSSFELKHHINLFLSIIFLEQDHMRRHINKYDRSDENLQLMCATCTLVFHERGSQIIAWAYWKSLQRPTYVYACIQGIYRSVDITYDSIILLVEYQSDVNLEQTAIKREVEEIIYN